MIHSIVQVFPQNNFTVYCYFDDGTIKLYDFKPLIGKGIFNKISNISDFVEKCTVMNSTLAWDISGSFDPYNCIDIDPEQIYLNSVDVKDPLNKSA